MFRQLWTIHAQFGDRTLLMAYFLMTGSTQVTYEDILIRFKAELDQMLPIHYREFPYKKRRALKQKDKAKLITAPSHAQPYYQDLLVDFEVAQAKAFTVVFSGAPHGC